MFLQKYLERMERMHLLIRRKATGNVEELAGKLQLSRRQTLEYIHTMREMGAPIEFCTYQRSYYYAYEVTFQVAGFVTLSSTETRHIAGGSVREIWPASAVSSSGKQDSYGLLG